MTDDHELLKDPRVYFLADEFFLYDLKAVALEKFRSKLDELWVSERLSGCVAEIYENTASESDDGIRAAVIDTCVQHADQLLLRKAFLSLIHEGGDFAVGLVRALAGK